MSKSEQNKQNKQQNVSKMSNADMKMNDNWSLQFWSLHFQTLIFMQFGVETFEIKHISCILWKYSYHQK